MPRAREPIHFRDPIHGTVPLADHELRVVESPAYQRLRTIKQLGFADHAFPGATHTRFAHGLGAMHMAAQMFDGIFPADSEGPLPPTERRRLRQLVRLSVLLHDIGHAPLSHATEGCMPPRERLALDCFDAAERRAQATHEDYTALLILGSPLTETLRQLYEPLGIEPEDVAQLITQRFPERCAGFEVGGVDYGPLLSQIVSGELDADRMDYLLRDSFYAGVNYGKFDEHWLLNNLAFHIEGRRAFLALSHRAIFAFEDFLLSRYHMFISVYYHHTSIGFDTMLARFIDDEPDTLALPGDPEAYLRLDDVHFWSILRQSTNPWAQRIVNRDLYRRIVEVHHDDDNFEVSALRATLEGAAIDHFISRDEGVLSRYYGSDRPAAALYVINRALQRTSRVGDYSQVFERYAQPARLTRVYVRPDQIEAARSCLKTALPRREQLRIEWQG